MNQILSVEMPKKKSKIKNGYNNKASTKSVVTFLCIGLIIFAIAMIGVSIYSMMNYKNKDEKKEVIQNDLPKIDVTQNASELEIEITCASEISSIEYNWEEKAPEKVNGNGSKYISLKVDIPSGANVFTINAIDSEGRENKYSAEYVGAKEPNITLFDPTQFDPKKELNVITVKCEETQKIKFMSYYYDEEPEQKTDINNTVGIIKIPEKQGEHKLTIKAGYEDGTEGKLSKKVYVPNLEIAANGGEQYDKFIINASSSRTIDKVIIIFNGVKTEETVNSETYNKEIDLNPGEPGTNFLEVTVYDKDGMFFTKKVIDKNRKN